MWKFSLVGVVVRRGSHRSHQRKVNVGWRPAGDLPNTWRRNVTPRRARHHCHTVGVRCRGPTSLRTPTPGGNKFHRPRPFARRADARRPISGELIAAIAGAPVELAETFCDLWFTSAERHCGRGSIVVFDDFVIGEPVPLLLEAAYAVKCARSVDPYEFGEAIDDDGYDEMFDEDGEWVWDEPTIPDRVLAAMAGMRDADRLRPGAVVTAEIARAFGPGSSTPRDEISILWALEQVVRSLADVIRIGDAAVVDARTAVDRVRERAA